MRFLADYIMKGRLQAMTVAATLALLSLAFAPASIVSSASVALVTLRRGAREGLYVLAFACLAATILSLLLNIGYQFVLMYGLVLWTPVWLIAIVLREARNLGFALEIAISLGLLAVLGFYLYQPQTAQFWGQVLATMIQPILDANPEAPVEQIKQSAQLFAHFMTGAIAAGTVYSLTFGLFLGRWWQATLYNPGGFKSEFLSMRGHRPFAWASLLLLAVASLGSGALAEFCWNLIVVVVVFYTLVGTAVLHSAFASMKSGRFTVPLLYITLAVIPHVMILMALCGLIDQWLDLRKKFSNPTAV
ncbi:MAG: hypothetical protein RL563_957 [Pseudomonadota bacterium]|jgi:hypothetical protein